MAYRSAEISRILTGGSASIILLATLLMAGGCGVGDEAPPESTEQALDPIHLPECGTVCKGPETCNSGCAFNDGQGWVGTTCGARNQCSGDGFEEPGDRPPLPPAEGTGEPRNYCARTNFRTCQVAGPFKLVRQFVKRECAFLGFGCKNAVYEVVAAEQRAPDCEACPCKFVTRKRCDNGRLIGGDWGGPKPSCWSGGQDRAVCN